MVEARHAVLDEQQAERVGLVALAGLDERHDHVGRLAARDERLRAVDDVAALDPLGGGLGAAQVAARARLGHRERAEDLAGRHAGEPLLLLLLRAHVHEVRNGEVVLDAEGAGQRAGTGADRLFADDRAEAVVLQHPGTAELLGNAQAEDARLARGEHRRAVDLAVGIPLLALLVRRVTLDELLDDVAERLVVLVVDVALHVRPCPSVHIGGAGRVFKAVRGRVAAGDSMAPTSAEAEPL